MKTITKTTKGTKQRKLTDDFDLLLKDLGITKTFVNSMDKNWKQKQYLVK